MKSIYNTSFFHTLIRSFVLFVFLYTPGFALAQGNGQAHSLFKPADIDDEMDILSLRTLELRARTAETDLRNTNKMIELPDVLELELFSDMNYVVEVNNRQFTPDGKMMIWSGRTQPSSSHSQHPEHSNTTIVVDTRTGEIGVFMSVPEGSYAINSVDGGKTYRVSQVDTQSLWNLLHDDNQVEAKNTQATTMEAMAPDSVPGGEQDNEGSYVIDVFVGFSNSAASRLGNIQLRAAQMIAETNNGLRNSLVRNVRLRLVGVGRTPNNTGITTRTLREGESWFAREIRQKGPDLLALVQTPTRNDIGGGVAWAPGFVSANSIYGLVAIFRHEVGHNVGALHCRGGSRWPYGYGWAVPGRNDLRTHMCGNQINYYSTPRVKVQGHVIGNAQTADVARLWRERAVVLSGHRRRTVPFMTHHQKRRL